MKPEIIFPYDSGTINSDLQKAGERLTDAKSYEDQSTVMIVPTRGGRSLCPRFVSALYGLMRPMNQKCFGPIFMSGMEVGDAFNSAIELVLGHPQLREFKYILTIEDDNLPPPDGLLKLLSSIKGLDAMGSLYWTKGEAGQPMIYGNPEQRPLNFIPQKPLPEMVQPCNGLGMGFTLFRTDVFHRLEKPWFKTQQRWDPATGVACYTQDLYAFERMAHKGMKVACDNRIKVGHLDVENDQVW